VRAYCAIHQSHADHAGQSATVSRVSEGFPGRKNLIWFAESVPSAFVDTGGAGRTGNPAVDNELQNTMAMLAAARVAIYPVYRPESGPTACIQRKQPSKGITQASQLIGSDGYFLQSLGSDASQHYADMGSGNSGRAIGGKAYSTNGCLR